MKQQRNKQRRFRIAPRSLLRYLGAGFVLLLVLGVGFVGLLAGFGSNDNASALDPAVDPDDPSNFTMNPATDIAACAGNSECFAFTIDTRLTNTLDTDPAHFSGTATTFAIPTSGQTGGSALAYNWIVNWGDGTTCDNTTTPSCAGTSSTTTAPGVNGISHTYATPGKYQITIRPNGAAANGWMNAFGFNVNTTGANVQTNKDMFLSINSPLTQMMRTATTTNRFNSMFLGARNAIGIPANLFANVSVVAATDTSYWFSRTFQLFAYNSTGATIPANLFSTIDTSNSRNFLNTFSYTFQDCAYNSTAANIPAGLFDAIHTGSGTGSFSNMFDSTFRNYGYVSTVATIPAGLFDSLDTSNGTGSFGYMFANTFYGYAYNSPVATIPDKLFDPISFAKATSLYFTFNATFASYGYNSQVLNIPEGLFGVLDTGDVTTITNLFNYTFQNCGYNSLVATIPAGLFSGLDTSSATSLNFTFSQAFNSYGHDSPVATIPAGLLATLNTSNVTNFTSLFDYAFANYASANTSASIPAGLFDSFDTQNGLIFSGMFHATFTHFAENSTVGTIPSGLFSTINTTGATTMSSMFSDAFSYYAGKSTVGTIPSGLFDTIDTSSNTTFNTMFHNTFLYYASDSTVGTIPGDLFQAIDTGAGTTFSTFLLNTFLGYAIRTATFVDHGTVVAAPQTFAQPYSSKVGVNGTPSNSPTVVAGNSIYPAYDTDMRTITAPGGAYAGYDWYRTDGTSCAVANPTPDCGPQTTPVVFPNTTEWIPTTSTEKGNVTFYAPYTIRVIKFESNGGSAIIDQEASIGSTIVRPADPTRAGYRFSGWYIDAALTTLWNFATDTVTDDTTLYAGWDLLCEYNPDILASDPNCAPPKPIVPEPPNTGLIIRRWVGNSPNFW